MPQVNANGITIEYSQRGSGPPLLLVMGLSGQMTDWSESLVDEFAEHFTVVTYDNRDAGLSTEFDWEPPTQMASLRAMLTRRPPAGVEYTVDDMANDAAGLLDALDIPAANVVGVSMGGMIAQSLAINHPAKVLSLTSIMSNTGDRKNGTPSKRTIAKVVRLGQPTRENAVELGTEAYSHFAGTAWDRQRHAEAMARSVERSWRPQGTARQAAAIAASPDRTAALGSVTVPTLVVHGLIDTLVKPSGGLATARAVLGSRLLMFPEMGHDLPAAREAELVAAVVANAERAAEAAEVPT